MMKRRTNLIVLMLICSMLACCKTEPKSNANVHEEAVQETGGVAPNHKLIEEKPADITVPEGMVWVPGAAFKQGAVGLDKMAMGHEKPAIEVLVDGFFMDVTEVTNKEFAQFVKETGYITVAERGIDWNELKKQVPEGTPKPHDSILRPGSLTFKKTKSPVANLYDFSQWWQWSIGANWKHPNGPESSIEGKEDYPVVQVAYKDAMAYCKWAGRRLPTEAEWELASRAGKFGSIYQWGNDSGQLVKSANTWEGNFPNENTKLDGFELRAPVKSYPPNAYGIYDMAGNVWEWTSDWYNSGYYKEYTNRGKVILNPTGALEPFTPNNPLAREKVIKGGSFLCSASYCASYRISARMGSSMDSALEHTGFRTVATVKMLQ
ncbi:Formylglycine-generating enzyme, required for sulfatase activity, contains SUMF1/FGE domain [Maribacter sedimenticola]|uniref:Formylglycine-generating enzyme, required for sulfatase activity, contains SUMF1/FGE domain n=2 Tax=Maribacter sedimenticola TaxID=228956 RepID=A0ABY1SFD8_9FLAO|nr:formylglycine-generating enzyme family protein [Maribacter sedimenticola]SNR41455.1 Formylglycine-generating enzyme, required for sulfatase activity, contains SUMF1/FGE domain [Maribacter sedimenticola]